jgi:hypothetical protein
MRRALVIDDFATDLFWHSLYMMKILFNFFISVCYFTLEDNSFPLFFIQQAASNNVQKKFFYSSKLDQLFVSIASFVVPKEVHSMVWWLRSHSFWFIDISIETYSTMCNINLNRWGPLLSKDFRRCFFQIYSSFSETKYSKYLKTTSAHRESTDSIWKTFKKYIHLVTQSFSNVFCNEKNRVIKYMQTWKIALWQRCWTLLYFL